MRFPKTLTHREVPAFAKEVWSGVPKKGEWNIDLSEVKAIDSSFLALLLQILREADAKQLKLSITGLPSDARALLEVYGIFKLFEKVLK